MEIRLYCLKQTGFARPIFSGKDQMSSLVWTQRDVHVMQMTYLVYMNLSNIMLHVLNLPCNLPVVHIISMIISAIHYPHRLIPADIADFQPEGWFVSADFAVPELLGFGAIEDDVAVFVDLDFGVGVPLALGGGAIEAEELDQLEALLADLNGLIGLFRGGVQGGGAVELVDFAQDAVADEAIDGDGPTAEEIVVGFLHMEGGIIADDHIVQDGLEVAQFDLYRGAVIVLDKLADFRLVGDVDIIDDHLFDGAVQVGDHSRTLHCCHAGIPFP